jgi:hypothetical protein
MRPELLLISAVVFGAWGLRSIVDDGVLLVAVSVEDDFSSMSLALVVAPSVVAS